MSEELEKRLRRHRPNYPPPGAYFEPTMVPVNPDGPEAADQLKRYREALGHIAAFDDSENFTIREMAKCARQALEQHQ